jgi:hypothetical protein
MGRKRRRKGTPLKGARRRARVSLERGDLYS